MKKPLKVLLTKRHFLVMMMMMMMMMMMNYFCGMVDQQKALFPVGTIVRDPRHHESLTRHKQGFSSLNVCIKY